MKGKDLYKHLPAVSTVLKMNSTNHKSVKVCLTSRFYY